MTHEPWADRRVQARSALQAEAILRRLGYECDVEKARIVPNAAEPLVPAAPSKLTCRKCGHELDGLVVCSAAVTCPECGHGQVLMVWRASDDQPREWWRFVVALLAVVGAVVIGVFSLMILTAIIL